MTRTSIVLALSAVVATGWLSMQCSTNSAMPRSNVGPDGSSLQDAGSADGGVGADAASDSGGESGQESGGAPNGPTLGGCPLFSPEFAYNQDISQSAIDVQSAAYLATLKANAPNIGLDYPGGEIYNIVPASQPAVPVGTTSWFGFDSTDTFFFAADAGAASAPVPASVQYENMGTPNEDHHMMILQQGTCQLFELYAWAPTSSTQGWSALVEWDLAGSNEQIPDSLEIGSTTAAGTPLLPGVIWPDEVAAGEIQHALDIVMPANAIAKCDYVHPASDGAWTATGTFPYGGRFRLKASYDTSHVTGSQALVVIRALQKYGMFNTDISGETRSSFRLGGLGAGQGWDQADITQLASLTWDDFDVVDLGTVHTMAGCN